MAYHPEDVPVTDSKGNLAYTNNPDFDDSEPVSETNKPFLYQWAHRAGDPIMVNNVHQILHAAGSLVTDEFGAPVQISRGNSSIETAITCVDMRYALADISDTLVAENVLGTITNDVEPIREKMLQESYLYVDTIRTVGTTLIRIDAETTKTISREISLVYDVVVDSITYRDAKTRALIESKIRRISGDIINGAKEFSSNNLIQVIDEELGDSVIGFRLKDINGLDAVTSFSIENNNDVIGIAPRLFLDDSGKLDIKDDIQIIFTLKKRS